MQINSCPRCNMYLTPGAMLCPNCQLNLQQYAYQQQQQHPGFFGQPAVPVESAKEKIYRKLLMIIAIVLMAEFVLMQVPSMFGMYSILRVVNILETLIWMSVPMVIALVLPKNMPARNVLIVFAGIYILARLVYLAWTFAMYGGNYWGNF